MEENKLDKIIEQQDKLIEQQNEVIKLLKASNERQFSNMKQEEMLYKNPLTRGSACRIEDYVVRNTMNTIVTDMFNGYSKGERQARLIEQCGRIIYNVNRKKLTETNGKLLLYHTAMNCTPPYNDEKEIVRIWNTTLDYHGL